MKTRYYPDRTTVETAIQHDDPLLVLVSFDGAELLVSNIDDAIEHHILLKHLCIPETKIDTFFRLVVNRSGADWTFVCPSDYKGIPDRARRIETYYNDGVGIIASALTQAGLAGNIRIPRRYRRHLDALKD